MIVECEKKTINLKSSLTNHKNINWVEQDVLVPDSKPDVMKVVMVTATPYISNKEISNNRIKVDGKMNYFIIYKTSDDIQNTRGMYMSYPFTTSLPIKDINKDMNIHLDTKIGNVIYSLPNERKISIKTEMIFNVKCNENMKLDIIQNFPNQLNIQTKTKETKCMNHILSKNSIIASKEEILIDNQYEDFYEILNIDSKIQNTDYKESYNKIMIKGDILLDVMYLSNSSKSQINRMPLEIPFSGMIELDNINDKSKFDINYEMRELSVKVNLENMTSKMMEVDFQIEVNINMYEEEEVSYIEDFYSQNHDIKSSFKKISPISNKIVNYKSIDIKETLNNILDNNYKLLNCIADINNLAINVINDKIDIEGNVKMDMLLQNIDTLEIESKNFELMINESIQYSKSSINSNITVKIDVEKLNASILSRDIEVKMRLNMCITEEEKLDINYTEKVEILDDYKDNLDSMYIYMIKENDTLWDIAKRYKTTINNIMETNSITDIEEIKENKKLLIIR